MIIKFDWKYIYSISYVFSWFINVRQQNDAFTQNKKKKRCEIVKWANKENLLSTIPTLIFLFNLKLVIYFMGACCIFRIDTAFVTVPTTTTVCYPKNAFILWKKQQFNNVFWWCSAVMLPCCRCLPHCCRIDL